MAEKFPVELTHGEIDTLVKALERIGVKGNTKQLTENCNYSQEMVRDAESADG